MTLTYMTRLLSVCFDNFYGFCLLCWRNHYHVSLILNNVRIYRKSNIYFIHLWVLYIQTSFSFLVGQHTPVNSAAHRWRQCLSAFAIYFCILNNEKCSFETLKSQFRFVCPHYGSINSNCALRISQCPAAVASFPSNTVNFWAVSKKKILDADHVTISKNYQFFLAENLKTSNFLTSR